MDFDFVTPINKELYDIFHKQNKNLSNQVAFYAIDTKETSDFTIALVGVEEYRGNVAHKDTLFAPNKIREQLYTYAPFYEQVRLLDLGNIKLGATYEDTLVALTQTLKDAFRQNLIVIILGGDDTLTQAQFKAYELYESPIQLAQITAKIYLEETDIDIYKKYLYDILKSEFLKKYNLLAYQSYFVQKELQDIVHYYQFDSVRVGKIRETIFEAEPLLREVDMVSFDISAIRYSDAPAQLQPSPNGLFGDEACMLAKFAGMSDLVSSIGFYNFIPTEDLKNITAHQLAQMVWYFVEGVQLRRKDYPIIDENEFYHYTVMLDESEYTFLKSKKTERWWMKIPYTLQGKLTHHLIPCTYKDYFTAHNGEMPERWMRNIIRLH